MGSSNPKRRTCRHCGAKLGTGGYSEVRILDHRPVAVLTDGGSYTRWKSKSVLTEYVCHGCAAVAAEIMKERRHVD